MLFTHLVHRVSEEVDVAREHFCDERDRLLGEVASAHEFEGEINARSRSWARPARDRGEVGVVREAPVAAHSEGGNNSSAKGPHASRMGA